MRLASIARHPVKSFAGEALDTCRVSERGLHGDRVRALVEPATHLVVSAKDPRRWPTLPFFRATLGGGDGAADAAAGRVRIAFPDGAHAYADDDDVDARLSRALGRDVRLVDRVPDGALQRRAHSGVAGMGPAPEDPAGHSDDALAVLAPGTLFDAAPIHLVTTASLRAVRDASGVRDADPRRFRANLVIDVDDAGGRAGEGAGFVENDWCGRTLTLGDGDDRVVLRVLVPAPRCVVPSLARDELPHDLGVLRALAAHNRIDVLSYGRFACLGVYASVERPGTVRVGDAVHVA